MNKNFSRLGRTLWAGFSSALLMVGLVAILPNLATASVPGGPGSENEIRIKLWVDYNNDGTRDTAEDETFARSTITIYNADSSVYDVRSYDIFDRVNGVVFNDNGQGPWRAEIAPQDGHTFSAAGPDQDGVDGTPITIPDLQLGQVYSVGLSAPWEVQLGRYGGGVIDGQVPFVTEPTTVCPANPAPAMTVGIMMALSEAETLLVTVGRFQPPR